MINQAWWVQTCTSYLSPKFHYIEKIILDL
jgi:hypothetical protein